MVLRQCWHSYYALLLSNLPLSFLLYSSLGSHVPNLPKTCNTFAKRVVRIMTSSDLRSHSEPLLKSLRLLKFSDIIHLEILPFVYQWYHKLSPSCFVNYFNPLSSIHSILTYNTRQLQIDNLLVKSVHTTLYDIHSLSYTGPKFWNSLSIDVKKIIKNLFPVFVNISRILWLMVIIILLIANVLRLYYL